MHTYIPFNEAGELVVSLPQLPPLIPFQQFRGHSPNHAHGLVDPLPERMQPEQLAGSGGREGEGGRVVQVGSESAVDRLNLQDEVSCNGVKLRLKDSLKLKIVLREPLKTKRIKYIP